MATLSTPSVANFDGTAEDYKLEQDHKRDVDKRSKYSLGIVESGRGFSSPKPAKPLGQRVLRRFRLDNETDNKRLLALRKQTGKFAHNIDVDSMTSDSSAEEDVQEASAAPEPDAGVTYSFDAPRGPSNGSDILNMAINKAVERFENKETEKLVKNEYEVVGRHTDACQEGYVADDDEYELV